MGWLMRCGGVLVCVCVGHRVWFFGIPGVGYVGVVDELGLDKWHSLYADTHYMHAHSVLSSIWTKSGLSEFLEHRSSLSSYEKIA